MIRQLRATLGAEHQRDYTIFLIWASIAGVMQGVSVTLLIPIVHAIVDGDYSALWARIGLLAVTVLLACIAHYVQAMRGFRVATTLLRVMHINIGNHLVTLPLGWFTGRTGSIAQIAAKGTLAVAGGAAHLLTPIIVGIAAPATVTVLMLFFDWRLALVLIVAAPLIWLSARGAAHLVARSEQRTHAATVHTSDRVLEFARCQGALRTAGRTTDTSYAPLEAAIETQRRAVRRELGDATAGLLLNMVTVQLVFAAIITAAAALALGGGLSGIELLAFLGIATRFVQPISEIGEYGMAMRQLRAELTRIDRVMRTTALPETRQATPPTRAGEVQFDAVTFGYHTDTPVLQQLSFIAAPHTMTAIVGPSGSGKTTITRLIARFYDVDSGAVRVGGVDVREQRTEDLMAQLALVFQDVYLFNDTLRANIRVGRPDASDTEIDQAAELAGVTEIADRLPQGWQTSVGEAGSALSGGERQRVSIARAILKNAPIVLLDEATAALDPENERYVTRSLRRLRERATLIVIAHKLTTVTGADQILVLDDHGQITEHGKHHDLLALDGRYADFWNERTRAAGWRLAGAGEAADASMPNQAK